MLQLKPLSADSISKALIKAKHYRLLNEPWEAESICRDILEVEPDNQLAILNLILAITDQFSTKKVFSDKEAKDLCSQLSSEYERLYYLGIITERGGKAALKRPTPRVKYIAYEYYRKAMELFERAEKIKDEDKQDAILRWNACARAIMEYNLESSPDEYHQHPLLDC